MRVIDFVLAAVAILLLAVPMLLLAFLVRHEDGGPALFRQQRVGRDGRIFTVIKFRSMTVDHSGVGTGEAQPGEDSEEARARFQRTEPGDPRVTRIGAIMRPSHLDELPQLLNILKGDMSFVGVRPDTPVQEGDYAPEYWRLRHSLRPGLTGPAQLRSDPLTFDQRREEESRWLRDPSLKHYVATLARTVTKTARRSSF